MLEKRLFEKRFISKGYESVDLVLKWRAKLAKPYLLIRCGQDEAALSLSHGRASLLACLMTHMLGAVGSRCHQEEPHLGSLYFFPRTFHV